MDSIKFLKWLGKHLWAIFISVSLPILLIIIVASTVILAFVGASSSSLQVNDTSTDIYFLAVENVKNDRNIQNDMNANILRCACIMSQNTFTNLNEAEKFIVIHFLTKLPPATTISVSTVPVTYPSQTTGTDATTTNSPTTIPQPQYEFISEDEIKERLSKSPFFLDENKINAIMSFKTITSQS